MVTVTSMQQRWTNVSPQRKRSRLAAALGVERRTLGEVLAQAHYNLPKLRTLSLADLQKLVSPADAERIFYLVQWERLQAHLEHYGTLPEENLEPLLKTLTPIFERHFSPRLYHRSRLNETLLALYRAELSGCDEDVCLTLTPAPAQRFLRRFVQQLGF